MGWAWCRHACDELGQMICGKGGLHCRRWLAAGVALIQGRCEAHLLEPATPHQVSGNPIIWGAAFMMYRHPTVDTCKQNWPACFDAFESCAGTGKTAKQQQEQQERELQVRGEAKWAEKKEDAKT